jgi:hypothetical protein
MTEGCRFLQAVVRSVSETAAGRIRRRIPCVANSGRDGALPISYRYFVYVRLDPLI